MAELAGHRAEIADLPEQPFQGFFAAAPGLRHEVSNLFREVDKDRTRFENRHWSIRPVMIDDCRHPVIGTDRQKLGFELIAAADIDRDHAVFETAFLEHDRDLPAVWRRPVIKVDHRTFSGLSSAISPAE